MRFILGMLTLTPDRSRITSASLQAARVAGRVRIAISLRGDGGCRGSSRRGRRSARSSPASGRASGRSRASCGRGRRSSARARRPTRARTTMLCSSGSIPRRIGSRWLIGAISLAQRLDALAQRDDLAVHRLDPRARAHELVLEALDALEDLRSMPRERRASIAMSCRSSSARLTSAGGTRSASNGFMDGSVPGARAPENTGPPAPPPHSGGHRRAHRRSAGPRRPHTVVRWQDASRTRALSPERFAPRPSWYATAGSRNRFAGSLHWLCCRFPGPSTRACCR